MKKTMLITGASFDSIGHSLVSQSDYLRDNFEIINVIKNGDCCEESMFKRVIQCDFSNLQNVKNLFLSQLIPDRIDFYLNCTGMSHISWFDNLDLKDFNKVFNVNFTSHIVIMKHILHKITDGVVINLISSAANIPMRCSLPYNTSKAALEMSTRQMARELTPRHGICFIGISPSTISGTNMTLMNDANIKSLRGDLGFSSEKNPASPSGKNISITNFCEFLDGVVKTACKETSGSIIKYGIF